MAHVHLYWQKTPTALEIHEYSVGKAGREIEATLPILRGVSRSKGIRTWL